MEFKCEDRGRGLLRRRSTLTVSCLAGAIGAVVASPGSGQQVLWEQVGFEPNEMRISLFEALGDLDGDGFKEFMYLAVQGSNVVIRSGQDGHVIKGHQLHIVNGTTTGFGASLEDIGLFDGDAVPDYAISAMSYAGTALTQGMVFLYSGATHEPILRIFEGVPGEGLGRQVVSLGDVNGDGVGDLGVSTLYGFKYRLYLGPDATLYREHSDFPMTGKNMASYGDWDGDGCDDYLVGEKNYGGVAFAAGRVMLLSGRTGEMLLSMEADQEGRQAGYSVCRGGDWDGDGVEDVVAGAPGTSLLQNTSYNSGVYVFSGADGLILHFFDGEEYCDQNSAFGWSVSSGRDVNGDGVPDLIVGAPLEPWTSGNPFGVRGSAFVFSGATRELLWEYKGSQGGERTGMQVALIADHDLDGLDDWMVLSPDYDATPATSGMEEGRFTIFAGAIGDLLDPCTGGPNSVTSGARLGNSGSIGLSANDFELLLDEMPQNTPAVIVHGRRIVPPRPFGAGELCLAHPLAVLGAVTTSNTGGPADPGSATLPVDLTLPPFSDGNDFLVPGETWAFQALYRDQGVRNSSNALEATFVP